MPQIKSYALSELAANISEHISRTYQSAYWITAEISKLNYYPQSGHCYPQLVEKKNGKIIADVRGFILGNKYKEINAKFKEVTGRELSDGMQIMFQCRLGFHAVYGFSLNILNIEPSYTLGEMARLRVEAVKRLKEEGIFFKNKEIPLPLLVRKLAVISVETSKGYLDFSEILQGSRFGKAMEHKLFPALLQGDAAVQSIISALDRIKSSPFSFDAVAIIRGGGGETGLDCYDVYALAREVCTFPIPIITGIGHATNLTVVEQVANKNLITPTDLAGFLMQRFSEFAERIDAAVKSLLSLNRNSIYPQKQNLMHLRGSLVKSAGRKIEISEYNLARKVKKLVEPVQKSLRGALAATTYKYPDQLRRTVKGKFVYSTNHLERKSLDLKINSLKYLKESGGVLRNTEEKIRILDPQNVLKRGFSLTLKNGKVVHDIGELEIGDEITTVLGKGKLQSTVKNKGNG